MTAPAVLPTDELLVARGVACASAARLLDDTDAVDLDAWAQLRDALARLHLDTAVDTLAEPDRLDAHDAARIRRRLFVGPGRIPPYECSQSPPGFGGPTAMLADIGGFYRAFGFQVRGDRPDHVVAELELAAFLAFGEAQARGHGDDEAAAVFASASATFVRDHLGSWMDRFAARVAEAPEPGPFAALLAALAALVDEMAAAAGVEPRRPAVPGDDAVLGLPDVSDDLPPQCAGCSVPEVGPEILG